MHIHLTYHILIHTFIHISYISFTHAYTYLILTYHIMFHFLSSFIYILCHFTLCFLFLSQYTCHHIAVLCFSYHFISCCGPYSIHGPARLVINRKSELIFKLWKICPQWGAILFGVATYFLFLFYFFKMGEMK